MNGDIVLRVDDAIELGELLEFLSDWVGFHPLEAAESLDVFTSGGYTVDELGNDLARFAFLLGGDGDRYVHGPDR